MQALTRKVPTGRARHAGGPHGTKVAQPPTVTILSRHAESEPAWCAAHATARSAQGARASVAAARLGQCYTPCCSTRRGNPCATRARHSPRSAPSSWQQTTKRKSRAFRGSSRRQPRGQRKRRKRAERNNCALHSTQRFTLARVSAARNLQRLLHCSAGNAAPAHAATASADAARRRARSQRACRARSPL
jgi:hypothetical protein